MIYEQRVYRAMPGRLPKLLARMESDTLPLWEKHGIRPVGFFTTLVGESASDLTYLLAWNSFADPDWKAKRADSEKDGPLVANISNTLLSPTSFSLLK